MWSLMAACDVLVNLRYPTMGETSGSVIRALSLGKPLVVSDVGWFAELPDDVVLKVPVDEYEVRDARGRARLRRRARRRRSARPRGRTSSASTPCRVSPTRTPRRSSVAAGGDAVDDAVLWRIAEAAAEVGIDRRGARSRARRSSRGSSRDRTRRPRALARSGCRRGSGWRCSSSRRRSCGSCSPAGSSRRGSWSTSSSTPSSRSRSRRTGTSWSAASRRTGYGFVYPVLIAPAWRLFARIPAAYDAAKAINAVVDVARRGAGVPPRPPARRAGRRARRRGCSTVAVPSMLYTGTLMTENAFYPLFVCVLPRARARARAADGRGARSLLLALCGLALRDARAGGRALPAVVVAPLLLGVIERNVRGVARSFAPLYGILVGGAVLALAATVAARPLAADAARRLPRRDDERLLASREIASYLLWHVAELDLYLGVIPFAALLALWLSAARAVARGRARSRPRRSRCASS